MNIVLAQELERDYLLEFEFDGSWVHWSDCVSDVLPNSKGLFFRFPN